MVGSIEAGGTKVICEVGAGSDDMCLSGGRAGESFLGMYLSHGDCLEGVVSGSAKGVCWGKEIIN